MSQRSHRWDCRKRNNYEKAVATHLAAAFLCTQGDVDRWKNASPRRRMGGKAKTDG